MYQHLLIVCTILAFIAVLIGCFYIGNWVAKKKIDVQAITIKANSEIPVFEQLEQILIKLLPASYQTMANMLTVSIKKAVEVAEVLWQAGQLSPEQRKTKAIELINATLALEKITITEKLRNTISLVVDLAAILFLPKSHTDETASTPVAEQK